MNGITKPANLLDIQPGAKDRGLHSAILCLLGTSFALALLNAGTAAAGPPPTLAPTAVSVCALDEQNGLDCDSGSGSDAAFVIQIDGDFNQSNDDGSFQGVSRALAFGGGSDPASQTRLSFVSAEADANFTCSGGAGCAFFGGQASGAAVMTFELRVNQLVPPPSTPGVASVNIASAGQVSVDCSGTLDFTVANASIDITVGPLPYKFRRQAEARPDNPIESFSANETVLINVGIAQPVTMSAQTGMHVGANTHCSGEALLDPSFDFDQAHFDTFMDGLGLESFVLEDFYEIEFSEGITNIALIPFKDGFEN